MADEVILDTNASIAATLESAILLEARPMAVVLPFIRQVQLPPLATAHKFSIMPAADEAAAVNEATDLANTGINPTEVSLTPGEVGIMYTVTDVSGRKSLLDVPTVAARGARAMTQKWETDVCTLFSSFSNSVGTTATALTLSAFQSAIFTLENADAPGTYVAVLGPKGVENLRTEAAAAGGTIWGNASAGVSTLLPGAVGNTGFKGNLYGIDIYASTRVPNDNTDDDGAMFSVNEAIAMVWAWPLRVELERDASLRATEVVITSNYAVAELRDAFGVEIKYSNA